jgi:hypothetical protein
MDLGKYKHYKGNIYEIIGLAKHSETMEELVIYRSMGANQKIWARPKDMFFENIIINGKTTPRFKKIK